MNIEEAIRQFEIKKGGKYSKSDLATIHEIVNELGITEFVVKVDHISNIKTGKVVLENEIGIHSTMIVAGMPFSGSTDRRPDEYYKHRPHHLELSGWIGKGVGGKETPVPPKPRCNGMEVTAGQECPYCGGLHYLE